MERKSAPPPTEVERQEKGGRLSSDGEWEGRGAVLAEAARSKGGSLCRRRDAVGRAEALLVREQDERVCQCLSGVCGHGVCVCVSDGCHFFIKSVKECFRL